MSDGARQESCSCQLFRPQECILSPFPFGYIDSKHNNPGDVSGSFAERLINKVYVALVGRHALPCKHIVAGTDPNVWLALKYSIKDFNIALFGSIGQRDSHWLSNNVAIVNEVMRWVGEQGDAETSAISITADGEAVISPGLERAVSRKRVLVADDNADMRQYLHRLLKESYEVETVSNGAEALDAIRRQMPDLVLSDVMMPIMDGMALLSSIREDPIMASMPVILLSARAGEEAQVEGLDTGADDYLIKPFSARELIARVSAALKIAQLRATSETLIREERARLLEVLRQAPAFFAQSSVRPKLAQSVLVLRMV